MADTPNHEYNVPDQGAGNWHQPLNENFEAFEVDIELRDQEANLGDYTPTAGAKFLATDSGVVYLGDGNTWLAAFVHPAYDAAADEAQFRRTVTAPEVATASLSGGSGPLELTVGGARVLELTAEGSNTAGNVLAGHSSNSFDSGIRGATIAGGGYDDGNLVLPNTITGNYGSIGGGFGNETTSDAATVGGGRGNLSDDVHATVGGGFSNAAAGKGAAIGGGRQNDVYDDHGTVGGGQNNEAGSDDGDRGSDTHATVGGGRNNAAAGDYSTVSGGRDNDANGGDYATVAGGENNTASADHATVAGGQDSVASGTHAFAAGRQAKARADGSFVWSSGSDSSLTSFDENEFIAEAAGGFSLFSVAQGATGVELPPGSGSWTSLSTRTAKSDLDPVDGPNVLDRIEELDISTWTYDGQDEDVRHMGPMAEEFYDAFGLGTDERHISNVDADGVALAAIQGLAAKLDQKDERIDDQQDQIERQQDRIDALETESEALRDETATLRDENDTLRERLRAIEDRLADLEAGRSSPAPADD